jgi:nucleoside-diphosphate-sugar epimerase
MSERVLVTGAAGLVGTAVLDLLAAGETSVTALVLDKKATVKADRVVAGDARDPAVVDEALRDADAVIHLAAIPNPLDDPAEVVFGHNTHVVYVAAPGTPAPQPTDWLLETYRPGVPRPSSRPRRPTSPRC